MKPSAYHVYPVGDLREHVTEGTTCWCRPNIEQDGALIIHNSMDQREKYETGELKPN